MKMRNVVLAWMLVLTLMPWSTTTGAEDFDEEQFEEEDLGEEDFIEAEIMMLEEAVGLRFVLLPEEAGQVDLWVKSAGGAFGCMVDSEEEDVSHSIEVEGAIIDPGREDGRLLLVFEFSLSSESEEGGVFLEAEGSALIVPGRTQHLARLGNRTLAVSVVIGPDEAPAVGANAGDGQQREVAVKPEAF